MKAAIFRQYGNPGEVVELVEDNVKSPADGEAIIAVEAAPIHLGDLYNIEGREGFRLPLPLVPGLEGIGRIREVGSSVQEFEPGDRVLFISSSHVEGFLADQQGSWREQLRLPVASLVPAPEGDAAQYANIINPLTAYVFLHDVTKPEKGEWLLQNAANSNVGRYLIKLAKLYGCRTVNVVRRESLIPELKDLGADAVIVDGSDLHEQVKDVTSGADIRFALDALAGEAPARLGVCLKNGGTVYNYGMVSKQPCQFPTWLMLNRDIRLHGFFAGTQFLARTPKGKKELIGELAELISQGHLPSKIAARYPLSEVHKALAHAAKGGAERDGKVILLPTGGGNL